MRFFITNLLAVVLLIQFSSLRAYSAVDENNVICQNCVDKNSPVGSKVEVDGRTWVLDKLHDPEGTPMWEAHPVFNRGGDVAGAPFDHEPPGSERLTGRDLTGFEDSDRLTKEERERLHRIQEKIVNRLNAETAADAGATTTELEKQVGDLNQAIQNAGQVADPRSNGQLNSTDPAFSIYDSIQGKYPGRGFSPDQAGWQLHDDHDYQSDHKDELDKLRDRLNNHQSQTPQQEDAKRVGYSVLNEADNAYTQNDQELGNGLLNAGKILVDIATDMIPLTSAPKDFYRAFVGKDPMTGEPLATWERAVAGGFFVVGIVTLGGSNAAKPWVRAIAKIAHPAEEEINLVARNAKNRSSFEALAKRLKDRFKNIKFLDGAKENQRLIKERNYVKLAWSESKPVVSAQTKSEQQFVRFFQNGKDMHGSWVADAKDVVGKTPEEIKEMFALEHVPDYHSTATIPQGTEMHVGFVGKNEWGGNENAIQYFIPKSSPSFFKNPKPITEVFRGLK
ncbi:MAG: pre-toxin TG domain-containing protein [Bdellovibrionales bacterium]|nr:pre-toxin TG domain-containing protein [Bdellovibrionales bacterium]